MLYNLIVVNFQIMSSSTISGMARMSYKKHHKNKLRKKDMDLPTFDLPIISKATDNFSSCNKLGEGGCGPVYKVMF